MVKLQDLGLNAIINCESDVITVCLTCHVAGRELSQDFVIASIVEPILLGLGFIVAHRPRVESYVRSS